jgi:hypothetical protein
LPALDFASQSPYTGWQTVANSQRYVQWRLIFLILVIFREFK